MEEILHHLTCMVYHVNNGIPYETTRMTHGKLFFFRSFSCFFSFLVRRSPAVPLRKVPRSCFNIPLQVWWFGGGLGMAGMTGGLVDGGWGKADILFLVACPVCFLRWGGSFKSLFSFLSPRNLGSNLTFFIAGNSSSSWKPAAIWETSGQYVRNLGSGTLISTHFPCKDLVHHPIETTIF